MIAFADGGSWRCDRIGLIMTDEALGEIDLDYARALAERAAKAKHERYLLKVVSECRCLTELVLNERDDCCRLICLDVAGWSAYPSIAVISISLPDRREGPLPDSCISANCVVTARLTSRRRSAGTCNRLPHSIKPKNAWRLRHSLRQNDRSLFGEPIWHGQTRARPAYSSFS